MNSKRYVLPTGMLKAAIDAVPVDHRSDDYCWLDAILQNVVRWQSENPRVPADGETTRIWLDTGLCNEVDDDELRCIAVEWQRRMFLAPEPVFDATLGGALLGRTFTREQANAIKNIIDTAVHG